ncbi:aromatic amino acid ammonia-lyase [Cochlodiniinecator piscidefendens]|uniref:aromatic amino acid ammonia-lyase n=1 Tax=Cochlodiniinecator piscidefendens TaxID=2715756 RepID=UPI00140C68C2|nr:aromatic amino acid ammonia-lyase [Cochlodiniinecator piscidefendens]
MKTTAAIPALNQKVFLNGCDLNCDILADIVSQNLPVGVQKSCWEIVQQQRDIVDEIVRKKVPAYGVTTGVGSQKDFVVSEKEVAQYNMRLVRAHATRVPGPLLSGEAIRAALIIMINEFAQGHSGVSQDLLQTMTEACNKENMPEIDASGSVGASDLVPLAQMAVWLLSLDAAKARNLPKAKETLSLINHNAVTLALGAFAIVELKQLLALNDLTAAATMEGFRGNVSALSEAVNRVHRRPGQRASAARIRSHLKGSKLWTQGEARFLQDPLSFRTLSQVHGAVDEIVGQSEEIWNQELNSVNDNPIIDPEIRGPNSHANMDTTRLTLALDTLRQALGKLADLSGERIQKLQWPTFSGLPTGLAEGDGHATGGVQFLNLGHIAASLVTSTKIWARPHLLISVGQLADGVEDTSGHALHAVHDLQRQIDTGWKIVAIELSIAIWAIHRRRIPIFDLGDGVRKAYEAICPVLPIGKEGDEPFDLACVIEVAKTLVKSESNLEDQRSKCEPF